MALSATLSAERCGPCMPERSSLPVQHLGGCAVVALPDQMDLATAPVVTDELIAVLNRRVAGVIADMSETSFCDASGVDALVEAHDCAHTRGSWVRVVAAQPQVRKIFRIASVDQALEVFSTLDDVLPPRARGSTR